jgi:hypothetical protein
MGAKIAMALHQVMEKVGYVQKTGKNAFHGYRYAGEADLLEKLRPAMVEAGLLLIPSGKSLSEIDGHGNVNVTVEYTLVHKDGEIWPEKIVAFGCGNDRAKNGSVGDKGVYKALTGANKYLLFKLFQIETGDDPEADEREKPAPDASSKTRQQAEDGVDLETQIITALLAAAKVSRSVKELDDWKASANVQKAFKDLSRDGKLYASGEVAKIREALDAVELFAA